MTSPNTIIADMQAEIERLKTELIQWQASFRVEQKMADKAESEAFCNAFENARLREALREARTADDAGWCQGGGYITEVIDEALSTPSDTSALEAIVKKAGEVMQKSAEDEFGSQFTPATLRWEEAINIIRSLPAVTLEDITKRSANHE